jgi:hypothetical protein
MGYIKSHSNYVLKTKHQNVNDGIIYERDAVTIGGLNQFAPGQVPIYKSSNFIITVNNEDNPSRNISSSKWEENENGEIWTLNDVTSASSANTTVDDAEIVIKQDYYSLRDFSYYGSCAELVRASINDIIRKFPGELYGPKITSKGQKNGVIVNYTDTTTSVGDINSTIERLPKNKELFLLDNPFKIDIYTPYMPINEIKDELKLFCNNGFENYQIIDSSNNSYNITNWTSTETGDKCIGDVLYIVNLTYDGGNIEINVCLGDEKEIYYLVEDKYLEYHIRPKVEFYNKFLLSLDNFEKIILNPNTEPKYTATFEIISENDFGYSTDIKSFTFPLGYGEYNIGANTIPFEHYLKDLSDIATFYDDVFCDNLYRSMTHESIKNFDWTFTRNYSDGEEEEYVIGGNKIANVLRLYGRELDEIKSYIDNINNLNTITYDDVNNLPDYFLSDNLDNDGWDLTNIYPLNLLQYTLDDANNKVIEETFTSANTVNNKKLYRVFSQNSTMIVKPYDKSLISDYPNGYFNTCCDDKKIEGDLTSDIYVDTCGAQSILRHRIKLYSSDREYSPSEINNQFMKRLRLNSRQILRHKGTLDGIEMILSLFGLKSKRWFDLLSDDKKDKYGDYDYEITEFTSFTPPILDEYDGNLKMCKIDWYNSTKTIQYNTSDYINGIYTPYQGLPIAYKEDDKKNRYIYPYFDKNSLYDGNPYYQMKGGWLSKLPFQFDKDNNIITPQNNYQLYTETFRTVKSVGSIKELVTLPMQNLTNGEVYFVNSISDTLAIVDGQIYDVKTEDVKGTIYKYFSVYINNKTVQIGDVYFSDFVVVSNPYYSTNNNEMKITLSDKKDNTEIKVYIIDNNIKAYANDVTINNFLLFENGSYFQDMDEKDNNFTHYFRINNIENKTEISPYGWEQLTTEDYDYYRLNSIVDYFKGNNPHNGNFNYDNGYEYLTYFSQLFKYAYDNELFDKRCYGESYYNEMLKIYDIGFKWLINEDDDCDYDYSPFIKPDSKIHYFGNFFANGELDKDKNIFSYPEVSSNIKVYPYSYVNDKNTNDNEYNLKNILRIHSTDINNDGFYGEERKERGDYDDVDGITHQIVNNKRLNITFKIKKGLNKDSLERIKYIDSVILPYMTQLLPSTTICSINYDY